MMRPETLRMVDLMFLTGNFIKSIIREEGVEKDDKNAGHHAIVTKGDVAAQDFILNRLVESFPNAWFITEEKSEAAHGRVVTDDNLSCVNRGTGFIVDPIDGTSQYNNGLYEWSISIGKMENGRHVGGAIFAPRVCGGLMVFNDGPSVEVWECGEVLTCRSLSSSPKKIKDSLIMIGPDTLFLLDHYGPFIQAVSQEVRTTNVVGSCALGLALVAAGKIDALIQPVQCPWDWSAGFPLVQMAGGKVVFYHYDRPGFDYPHHPLVWLDKPDLDSYSPTKRNIGFIAGRPELVDFLFHMLLQYWR